MEPFGIIGMTFGITGMGLGIFGLIAFMRLAELEKQLKESGILDKDDHSNFL